MKARGNAMAISEPRDTAPIPMTSPSIPSRNPHQMRRPDAQKKADTSGAGFEPATFGL